METLEYMIDHWNSLGDFEGTSEEFAAEEAATLAQIIGAINNLIIVDGFGMVFSPEVNDDNCYVLSTARDIVNNTLGEGGWIL